MSFRSRCAVFASLLSLGAMSSVSAADRCTADTLFSASFDTVEGPTIAGIVAGLEYGTLEVRSAQLVVATADVERGAYDVELPELPPEAMIEVRVRGLASAGEDFIELASLVGTVAQLRDEADADGTTRIGRVPTLAVSPESSARYALFAQAAAAPTPKLGHECALASATAALDPAEVFERAAVLKILIADGTSVMRRDKGHPPTTLELLVDGDSYESTVDDIESDSPGRIAALQTILAEPFCNRFDEVALFVVVERLSGEWLSTFSGEAYQRIDALTGINTDFGGSDGYTISCSGDVADITFAGTRVSTSYPTRIVNGVPTQVSANNARSHSRITRIDSSTETLLVSSYQTTTLSFPFNPTLPTEVDQYDQRLALVRAPAGTPFDAGSLAGEYLLPTSGASGDLTANRVLLNGDGSGTDLDAGSALTWEVDGMGLLSIEFADREARVVPLRDESPFVRDVLAVVVRNDGERAVAHKFALQRDPAAQWADAAAVVGNWQQGAGRVSGSSTFHYQFGANHDAPSYNAYFEGEFEGQQFPAMFMHWSLTAPDTIVLRRCESYDGSNIVATPIIDREPVAGECDYYHRRREWTLYSIDAANAYVHEVNEEWYSDPTASAPAYRFSRAQLYAFDAGTPAAKRPLRDAGRQATAPRSTVAAPSQQD